MIFSCSCIRQQNDSSNSIGKEDYANRLNLDGSAIFSSSSLPSEKISFEEPRFTHIHFKRIPLNEIQFIKGEIRFEVDLSPSFVLHAFESIKEIRLAPFQWKFEGQVDKKMLNMKYQEKKMIPRSGWDWL